MTKTLRIIVAVAILVVTCSALSTEQIKKAETHAAKCIENIGVSRDDVLKVRSGDFSVTDTKIECFAKCFLEESGLMNAEGDFLDEVAIEKLSVNADKSKVEVLVNTCKLRMGSNPCETAYKIYKCYIEHKAL